MGGGVDDVIGGGVDNMWEEIGGSRNKEVEYGDEKMRDGFERVGLEGL